MNSKLVIRSLVGSFIVYVTMAACVATETPHSSTATTGAGGSSGMGNGGFGGFVDAMVDPVPDANADIPSSGTRLKARRYIADDGARSEITGFWYDSARKEDCAFTADELGQTRCVPFQTIAYAYYEDNQCTQPIASPTHNTTCQSPKKYVGIYDASQCAKNGPKIHEFGTPVVPSQVWFLKSDGACVTIGGIEISVTDWHRLGKKILPTEFVAATLTTDL